MLDKDPLIDDPRSEHQSMKHPETTSNNRNQLWDFCTDFLTGFGALFLIGIILFVLVPLLLITFKIGVALVVPIAVLGAGIILIALFGRFLKFIIKKR